MSMVLCDKSDITAIADKIRAAKGTTEKMTMKEIIENCGGNSNSGDGASSLTTGTFSVSMTDELEPGINEYTLTSNDLQTDSRLHIEVYASETYENDYAVFTLNRSNPNDEFEYRHGFSEGGMRLSRNVRISNTTLKVYGSIASDVKLYFTAF